MTNFARSLKEANYKYVVQWFDATANLERLSSREKVCRILDKCKAAGIDGVAVGIKPLSGHTLYPSQYAPRLTEWKGYKYPQDYDLLQTILVEGHKRNLDVHCLVMFVSEGHKEFASGPVYSTHPEWQSTVYDIDIGRGENIARLMPITELKRGALTASLWGAFCNPILPDLQKYELDILREVLRGYREIDALVVDRVRYNGLNSDFSPYSRAQFEKYLGGKIKHWPEDIFKIELENGQLKRTNGPYFKQWCKWRAQNIKDYILRIHQVIEEEQPGLPFGDYVGAWYPDYFDYGVNWASERFIPTAQWAKEWYSPGYEKTGYAEIMDYLAVGCYFPQLTMEEAEKSDAPWWQSVEGGCKAALEATRGVVPVYASIWAENFAANAEKFTQALKISLRLTRGLKIFDLSQIEKYDFWDEIGLALKPYKRQR